MAPITTTPLNTLLQSLNTPQGRAQCVQALGRVAVIYGGTSAERSISLKSGGAIIAALQAEGVSVVPCEIGSQPLSQLQALQADRVLIALHGPGGEDGRMQALLDFLNLPYTGSRVLASALCMDKQRTKQIWQAQGLPTPPYALLNAHTTWAGLSAQLGPKVIVKPVHEGSSIGMSLVTCEASFAQALACAQHFDHSVMAEAFIQGAEYTVALLNGHVLPPIRLQTPSDFYDFNAKYQANDTQYHCPCGLNPAQEAQLKALALAAFNAVGAEGWGRVDIMANAEGQFYLLEVNTVPGMTSHSLVPMAAKAEGIDFGTLVLAIASQTL